MPRPTTDTLRLRDGRTLEFAQYGDPAGVPAVFFHGFIGSHHQSRLTHEVAARHGFRLIAPNRPGVGRSTPRRRSAIADSVDDVRELADALGVESFCVLGVSGGGPYALACLARLPARVRLAVVLSGLGPLAEPDGLGQMSVFVRRLLRASNYAPFLARWLLAQRGRAFRQDPEAFLDGLIARWSGSDQELFARAEVREMFLDDLREVFLHGEGAAGLAQELRLYFRWGFRLADLPPACRVLFWHGEGDRLVPPAMSQYMARLIPGAELTLRPGGHFMVLDCAEEIVRRARAALNGDSDGRVAWREGEAPAEPGGQGPAEASPSGAAQPPGDAVGCPLDGVAGAGLS
jgi:pimeloyl-ACP methyl ester carboxylesterase